MFESNNS